MNIIFLKLSNNLKDAENLNQEVFLENNKLTQKHSNFDEQLSFQQARLSKKHIYLEL